MGLGLGLETITDIVHDGRDRVAALRAHHRADPQTRAAYQAVAAQRWGAEVVAAGSQKVEGWSRRQWDETGQQWDETGQQWVDILKRLVALIEDGAASGDPWARRVRRTLPMQDVLDAEPRILHRARQPLRR